MKIGNSIKDRLLFLKIKNKDRLAFIKAYDLYVDQLYRFIYFKVGNSEEAEDLTSSVFLKTWTYLQENSVISEKTLKSLLYKISRNLIIDHYRKINRHGNVFLDSDNIDVAGRNFIDEKQNLIKQNEIAFDLTIIETKLPELKDEYREIIILRFINELSIKEIAEILEKSKGNVRILIYRALKALKNLMEQK
ncbi:RNA polymerase sigma factor [Patescibacteria group bacterium]|nr:RNA polymerase sigma factor [Patescibacteria group bacterium]MBU1870788.1 RNA polymerase sigma factor [Patescibacteria group bacterium]